MRILTLVYILRRLLWAHTLLLLRASARADKTYGTYGTYGTYVVFNTCLHNMRHFVGAHIVCITREREGVKGQTQIADRTQMHS